jgi:hypothetical protein
MVYLRVPTLVFYIIQASGYRCCYRSGSNTFLVRAYLARSASSALSASRNSSHQRHWGSSAATTCGWWVSTSGADSLTKWWHSGE